MIILISPAKTMDFDVKDVSNTSMPSFLDEAAAIADELKSYSPRDLSDLMNISPRLAELNANRYTEWDVSNHNQQGKPAVLVYKGDVYQGLDAETLKKADLEFLNKHLRILSGLYGILKPLDRILPYRLDMGTAITVGKQKNLYDFWSSGITDHISKAMKELKTSVLVNLASEEYFKTVDVENLDIEVITPVFKDLKNGKYKVISFFAKKARGMMARYIADENIENPEDLKLFNQDGYYFDEKQSGGNQWVFARG